MPVTIPGGETLVYVDGKHAEVLANIDKLEGKLTSKIFISDYYTYNN